MKKQILDLIGIEYIDDEPKEEYKSYTPVMNGVTLGVIFAGAIFLFIGMLGLLTGCNGDDYSRLKYCIELCVGAVVMFLGQVSSMVTEVYDRQELLIKMVESSKCVSEAPPREAPEASFDKMNFAVPVSGKENEVLHIFWDRAKPNMVIYELTRKRRGVQEAGSGSIGINKPPIPGECYIEACKSLCRLLKDAIKEKGLISTEELQVMETEWTRELQ